jgi:hypothetical protein
MHNTYDQPHRSLGREDPIFYLWASVELGVYTLKIGLGIKLAFLGMSFHVQILFQIFKYSLAFYIY